MTDLTTEWDSLDTMLAAHVVAADHSTRRPADPGYEAWMRDLMNEGLSPEEWAARHAQDIASFSGGEYHYPDPLLDAWVQRLDAILFMSGAVAVCRRHYMTPNEIRAVLEREAEPF